MTNYSSQTGWYRYFIMLITGLLLFIASMAAVFHYILESRDDSSAQDAYDYHALLGAQLAMTHLVHRLELASIAPATAKKTGSRLSLKVQMEITWSRFRDLVRGESARHTRLIPGIRKYVADIEDTLLALDKSLNSENPDYSSAYKNINAFSVTFSQTFTALPVHLLPIQLAERQEMRQEQLWYYSAVSFSSLVVLLLYGFALRQILTIRKKGM
ncbi:MAG: hypothetical protein GY862_10025 [Gammaproteobacteria bacterium]|nr:hypothetical protein [Gammaproteobacteria bacterium]